jgi:hypothetical protein
MTNLNNLKEYLDSKLNEEVRSNNAYPKARITSQFCDGLQYLIDQKEKDVAQCLADAKTIMGANISDQTKDGNTVIQSASTTGATGSPHYNEYELQKLQMKMESMEGEVADMKKILNDFAVLHKDVSGNKWLPRNKRMSIQKKTLTGTSFFQKRLAS